MKRKIPILLVILATLLMIDISIVSYLLFEYKKEHSFFITIPLIAIGIAFIINIAYVLKSSYRDISNMNTNLESSGAEYINSIPEPVVVVNDNGEMIWYNEKFYYDVAKENDLFGYSIKNYINVGLESMELEDSYECNINNKVYSVSIRKYNRDDSDLFFLFFTDNTKLTNLEQQLFDSRPVVIIFMIDNYDDIMKNAKESEKAKTSVETEQIFENFMADTNGIIKKVTDDTFIAVIQEKYLNNIIEKKFDILEKARNIKINEKSVVTLSVGVGHGTDSLAENEKIANQCIDMALGRGGDQAVLKTENGFRFFGGVSKGVEKKSRAKIRIIANAIQELIEKCDTTYIMGHAYGDLDSIGAATGLAGAIRLLDKNAVVVVDKKKNMSNQLIDMINDSNTLKSTMYISPSDAVEFIRDNDLLIIVDTHNKDIVESKQLYKKAKNVVVIDHHRKCVNFIDDALIFHHEPYASSASEMVAEVIQYFKIKEEELSPCYAEALMAGITLDTKNFVMRTGVRTFEAAAYLKKLGADTVVVKTLFSNSVESYKRKTQIVSDAVIHNRCAIAMTNLKGDDVRLVSSQAADELLNISNVDAAFVVSKMNNNVVNISARSLGTMNVQVIMELLDGGGHQTMAATQIPDVSIEQAVEMLKKVIDSVNEQ